MGYAQDQRAFFRAGPNPESPDEKPTPRQFVDWFMRLNDDHRLAVAESYIQCKESLVEYYITGEIRPAPVA